MISYYRLLVNLGFMEGSNIKTEGQRVIKTLNMDLWLPYAFPEACAPVYKKATLTLTHTQVGHGES